MRSPRIALASLTLFITLASTPGLPQQQPATTPAEAPSPPATVPPAPDLNAPSRHEYVLLATSRTSTMRKEMQEAAGEGYRFAAVMGGETAGGSEVVVIMTRPHGATATGRYDYELLATTKTSTMQKELQEAADRGFVFRGQTVFKTTFGGEEVVVILERTRDASPAVDEYLLLATSRTSTMQKELRQAGTAGFELVGMTVSRTAFGGDEMVSIMRRPRERAP